MNPIPFNTQHAIRNTLATLLLLATFKLQLATGTVVTGHLSDISIQDLNTKIMFAPTNEVLLVPSGLSAGPPKIITTANGAFSVTLEPGNYTVSLPLITWRHPFCISVFDSGSPVNITNFLCSPLTYIYTNRFIPPLHVNTARVTAWSTNTESSLLTSATTITAGTLSSGNVITIEAFGSYSDPAANAPNATFNLKLGSATIVTQSQTVGGAANWYIRALITVRTAGTSGIVVGTLVIKDDAGLTPFPATSATATINITGSLTVALTATVQDFTGEEAIHCDQLVVHLE